MWQVRLRTGISVYFSLLYFQIFHVHHCTTALEAVDHFVGALIFRIFSAESIKDNIVGRIRRHWCADEDADSDTDNGRDDFTDIGHCTLDLRRHTP